MKRITFIFVFQFLVLATAVLALKLDGGVAGGFGELRHLGPSSILLIGSSHTQASYSPQVLERELGADVHLFGYNGLQPAQSYVVLDQALGAPGASLGRLVVVEVYWEMLRQPVRLSDPRLFYDAPPAVKVRLAEQLTEGKPLPRRLTLLRDLLLSEHSDVLLWNPLYRWIRGRYFYHGGYRVLRNETVDPAIFANHTLLKQPSSFFVIDPAQDRALRQIGLLLRRHGVNAVFVQAPMPRQLVAMVKGYRAIDAQIRAALQESGYPYLDFNLDDLFDASDPQYFADDNHLNSRGAERFSSAFAERMRPFLH